MTTNFSNIRHRKTRLFAIIFLGLFVSFLALGLIVRWIGDTVTENRYKHDPLSCAVESNAIEYAETMLSKYGRDPNERNTNGLPALTEAVYYEYPEMVELLVRYHADLTLKDKQGMTALDWARKKGNPKIIKILTPPDPSAH